MNVKIIKLPLKYIIELNITLFFVIILICLFFTNGVFASHTHHSSSFFRYNLEPTHIRYINPGVRSSYEPIVEVVETVEVIEVVEVVEVVEFDNADNASEALISNLKKQIVIVKAKISEIIENLENERENQGNTRLGQKGYRPNISFEVSDKEDRVDYNSREYVIPIFSSEYKYDINTPYWISSDEEGSNILDTGYYYQRYFNIQENQSSNDRSGDIVITASNRYGSSTDRFRITQRGRGENTRANQRGPRPTISFERGSRKDVVDSEYHRYIKTILSSEIRYHISSPDWINLESKEANRLGLEDFSHRITFNIEENRSSNDRSGDIVITASNIDGSATDKFRITQRGRGR